MRAHGNADIAQHVFVLADRAVVHGHARIVDGRVDHAEGVGLRRAAVPSGNPQFKGRTFGSNAAANWGFHYGDTLTEPRKREVVTIYEVDATGERNWARAVYNYRWTPQTDPFGVVHPTIDYPGVPVDPATITRRFGVLDKARVPRWRGSVIWSR